MKVEDIEIKKIHLGHNIRQIDKKKELNNLMQTIKDNGLLQPIGVKIENNGEYYEILWGNRRLQSCKNLGWKTIPCVIFNTDEAMSEEEFITINAIENLQQSPNTLFELGRICRILRKSMGISEIAVKLGLPKERVKNALDEIAKLPVKWQKRIKLMDDGGKNKDGKIPISTAMKVTRLRGIGNEVKDKLLDYIVKNDITLDKVEVIATFLRNGILIEDAINKSKGYRSFSIKVIVDAAKFSEAVKNFESFADLAVYCINKQFPNLSMKSTGVK